jgi:3-phosphoshikimate 1-carboxyvinyltransferase
LELTIQTSKVSNSTVVITGSKSESNRLLLLQALFPQLEIQNLSNSDDSQLMQKALNQSSNLVDIHHAGTAMRFLTAYYASKPNNEVNLTGSKRMKERPIKILVDALKSLGCDISYIENEGFPPLKIIGKKWTNNKVVLKANVSSQYISALLLTAAKSEKGLTLVLEGEITSVPYIKMTLNLLKQIGVDSSFVGNQIKVIPNANGIADKTLVVESDWSSASYYFSIVALSELGTEITLSSYIEDSLQGDSILAKIYEQFGVSTVFKSNTITLKKVSESYQPVKLDLINAPDIAQTIAVTALVLGVECHMVGLHTLKIKETDRLVALKTEIEKLGGEVQIDNKSLLLKPHTVLKSNISVATYNDHRMAMAFAPIALKVPVTIEDAMVVSKSYPTFWKDLKAIGFKLNL